MIPTEDPDLFGAPQSWCQAPGSVTLLDFGPLKAAQHPLLCCWMLVNFVLLVPSERAEPSHGTGTISQVQSGLSVPTSLVWMLTPGPKRSEHLLFVVLYDQLQNFTNEPTLTSISN